MLMQTTEAPISANDLIFAREAAETLNTSYPGHLWAVTVNGGMVDIRNLMLSDKYGYRLSMPATYSMSDFKARALKAGGEILERYRVSRGEANFDHLDTMAVDFAGRPIGDISK